MEWRREAGLEMGEIGGSEKISGNIRQRVACKSTFRHEVA